jgi:hypothetical protein
MTSVQEIIDVTGGWEHLRSHPLTLRVEGFMPLSLETIGPGPRGGFLLSIMHSFEQNGDLMRDPDLVVEVVPQMGWWLPVSYRQDSLAIYQEAVVVDDEERLIVHRRLVRDLQQFMAVWNKNLREQGFVAAARKLAGG